MRVGRDLRPMSLTHVLSKGLEWYPREFTMDIIEDLIDTHQYGSVKGISTVLALVELVHCWLAAIEPNGKVMRIHLLDFRKAFERVGHTILLPKLANAGLHEFLIKWITNYLCERKQRITIGSTTSELKQIKAGVLHCTLFGPVTFLMHINDLRTDCNMAKYVDDATMWEVCEYTGVDSDIQIAADQATIWSPLLGVV